MAKILVVDDAKFMRATLTDILQKAKHEIVGEASTGQEAVMKFKELSPDIITMDVTMPDMNGIEATRKIIQINKNANIIICSAMGQQKVVNEATEAGVRDYNVKPFEESRVVERVNRLLSKSDNSPTNL